MTAGLVKLVSVGVCISILSSACKLRLSEWRYIQPCNGRPFNFLSYQDPTVFIVSLFALHTKSITVICTSVVCTDLMEHNVYIICVTVVVRVDDKPIRLQLCDTAGQVRPFRLYNKLRSSCYNIAFFIV